ncbi:MAG: hypothetical protein HC906_04110, partial [Bacteroidales bacterium]|nr:hypothetical protein [Bacteroidales bacterium]
FIYLRTYEACICGIKLHVDSVAFQEQDSVVAACASSAIWSTFQVTGRNFQHKIETPVEITKSAIKYFPYTNRHFPNYGLTSEQMAHAIRNVGLEPFLVDASSESIVTHVYAFHKAKIPLVLGVKLINKDNSVLGFHAVSVMGYSIDKNRKPFFGSDFYLYSSHINKLYVHDDQVGPFAKMELIYTDKVLTTDWIDENGNAGNIIGLPTQMILPLYPKIRIPLTTILRIANKLDELINKINSNVHFLNSPIEWDVFLSQSNEFKQEILNNSSLSEEYKLILLQTNMPKFIWRVNAIYGEEKTEFIFDTTDIEQGEIFLNIVPYSFNLTQIFKLISLQINLEEIRLKSLIKIIKYLQKSLE